MYKQIMNKFRSSAENTEWKQPKCNECFENVHMWIKLISTSFDHEILACPMRSLCGVIEERMMELTNLRSWPNMPLTQF